MNRPHIHDDVDFDLHALIADAVKQIIKHEDADRFLDWLRASIGRYFVHAPGQPPMPAEGLTSLAVQLGRTIWNATPLPRNRYRPSPLPPLKRNDPCPCGSGAKFKRCCGRDIAVPSLEPATLWPTMLVELPAARRDEAVRSGAVPFRALIDAGQDLLAREQPGAAVRVLAPLFEAPISRTDEAADVAASLLCDAYDCLGRPRKKERLLDEIIATVPASSLRSGALARHAAMLMDAGRGAEAWEAWQRALRDCPDDPSLGLLEIQMLLNEGNGERARDRARVWLGRVERMGDDVPPDVLELFREIATDPVAGIASMEIEASLGAGERLRCWLEEVRDRPLPTYRAVEQRVLSLDLGSGELQATLRRQLAAMGVTGGDLDGAVGELSAQLAAEQQATTAEETPPSPADEEAGDLGRVLEPSADLAELERGWQLVVPVDKPFSVGFARKPMSHAGELEDPWDIECEDDWCGFLEDHPEAFDSLEILDDVATALHLHPSHRATATDAVLLAPLLERAAAIVDAATGPVLGVCLRWSIPENRPALRAMARLVTLRQRQGDDRITLQTASRLLELNPDDNHGMRALCVDLLLRSGEDALVEHIAAEYPDDMHASVGYGHALALFRMGRLHEAQERLDHAIGSLPKCPRYLLRERVRKPKLHADGIRIGGDDQAWLYRESMRDVWKSTPNALAWLRRSAPR